MLADAAIMSAVARLPFICSIPTQADMKPPRPICIKPSRAEAVPAFRVNGDKAMAAALGYVNPQQASIKNRKHSVGTKPQWPVRLAIKKPMATIAWKISTVRNICLLLKRLASKWLNWLLLIKPTERPANMKL